MKQLYNPGVIPATALGIFVDHMKTKGIPQETAQALARSIWVDLISWGCVGKKEG